MSPTPSTRADPALELNYRPWLPADRDAAILDLGCGSGRVLNYLSALGYTQLEGVDRDAESLKAIGELPGVRLDCRDVSAEYLAQRPGRYKLIVLRQMIYYVDRGQVMAFLAALKGALADDGLLIVEFFNGSLLSSRMTELKDPFIRTAYTEHAMRRLFDASGLRTHHIGPELRPISGLRTRVYLGLRALWMVVLRGVYILERGFDDELPRIHTKSIIAVAGLAEVTDTGLQPRPRPPSTSALHVLHLWQDYSPNLFDKAHPLCLAHGLNSEVVCQAFIDNGAAALPGTYFLRKRSPEESNSRSLIRRLMRWLRRSWDSARFTQFVKLHLRQCQPDVLHIHFGTTAAMLAARRALPDLPMVVSFYGVDVSEALRNPDTLRAYQHIFRKAAILHVLCDEASHRLQAAGCPIGKICIANLPANLDAIPEVPTDIVSNDSATRFLIPARFVEKKGHRQLLVAFKSLRDSGAAVKLTCFGYGPTSWLTQAVSEMGLSSSVVVLDNRQSANFTAEYIQLLRVHDIIVAPSIRSPSGDDEGGPALTLVMAQASGKPVIVSDFPGAERSVTDGIEGLVIPAGNAAALANAMRTMLGRPKDWERMGKAGQRRVRSEFSADAYWATLSKWYFECANKRGDAKVCQISELPENVFDRHG